MKKIWKGSLAIAASVMLTMPSIASATDYNGSAMNKDQLYQKLNKTEKEEKQDSFQESQKQKEFIDVDTLIVKYNKTIPAYLHKQAGTQVISSFPALGYDVVYIPKGQQLSDVIKTYKKYEAVTSITPSVKYKKLGEVDPKKSKMYYLQMLNLEKALKYAGKNKVTVAVIDAGVNFKHPELASQMLPPYNAAAPAKNVIPDLHGTHVAGIIAATANNGIGGHGINPNAKILPIDVFGGKQSANDYTIAQGIMYAIENKADVINMSLGSFANSAIMAEAVQKAIDAGITVVAAAGNDSSDEYFYPAAYQGVISVGNINSKKTLSESSNYGPSVDLVAPGEDIYSTAFIPDKRNTFMKLTGTSMASPVVAGVASLLKSKYPKLTPYEVEYILENTATDLGQKGYDLTFANGLVNPVAALTFDIKKLPKHTKINGKDLIKVAKPLKQEGENLQTGKLTSQEEIHWYKMDVKKGEHVQTVLDATANYDYAMDFYFYPSGSEGKEVKPKTINQVKAGKKEGYLYSAENDGTLVVGIKDANGNYDKSGKSSYTFTAEKFSQLTANTNSEEKPIEIKNFPYSVKEQKDEALTLFQAEEGPDHDSFTFEVTEPKVLSATIDGLPGVNSSISVSMLSTEKEGEQVPIVSADDNGIGEGEHLSFKAEPGIKYTLTVSNESMPEFSINALLGALLGAGAGFNTELSFDRSAYPYNFKMEQVDLPEDEDGLPIRENLDELLSQDKLTSSEYADKKSNEMTDSIDGLLNMGGDVFTEKQVADIVSHAKPVTGEDQKAYFQVSGDQDFYRLNPTEDSIYSFIVKNGSSQQITSNIYEYDEESKMLTPFRSLGGGLEGILSALFGQSVSAPYVALKKNTQYYIKLENRTGNISADPYILSVKKIMNSPEQDADHNDVTDAVTIQTKKPYQNYFIYTGDTDYYYYKHKGKEKIMDLTISNKQPSIKETGNIPKDLLRPTIFSGMLVEDTNGNKQIDNNEMQASIPFGASLFSLSLEDIELSFKAKNGIGYFIMINPFLHKTNVTPYEIQLNDLRDQLTDEDGKVSKHIPAKPIKLKKVNNTLLGQGYMNAGVPFGDTDHFVLNLQKASKVSMILGMDKSLDGIIAIFDEKGKRIKSFDQYGEGDEELAHLKLGKGKYFIEVSEANGKASSKPYKLTVLLK